MSYTTTKYAAIVIVIATAFAAVGCGSRPGIPDGIRPTRVVVDDLGRRVTVPTNVERVVSLAPSITENVFAVGAGERLVGVTTFCNYPDQARSIAKIGDTMNPNMEAIVALKPDVVLVSTASQIEAFTKTLEQNGVAVYVTDPRSLDGVFKSLGGLGGLLGTDAVVEKLLPKLRERVDSVTRSVAGEPRSRAFVQVSREPLFTIGKGAFLNDVIEMAGGVSVTADVETAFPRLKIGRAHV